MALTKCKECKKEVSSSARRCPHCGVDDPGITAKGCILVGLAMLIPLAALITFLSNGTPAHENSVEVPQMTDAERAAAQKTEIESCREDLQCWGQENWFAATNRCEREIELLVQDELKWTDSYPDTKMSQRGWLNQQEGTLTYYGDQVQISNGYGTFENFIYRCDYDPTSKRVTNVHLESGKL